MFSRIASFEFRYQLRQPVFWVVAILFFLITFGSVVIDQISIGSGGNVLKNSPFAIAQTTAILSIFYMFVTAAFVANVIVRDYETGFGPIIQATRIKRFDYLIGRFVGAYGAAALSFAAVPLALFLGSMMPWVDKESFGPNLPLAYAYAYGVIALPNLLLTSAVFFAVATMTRSMSMTYVGVMAFLVAWIAGSAALNLPSLEDFAAYLEPFGIAAYAQSTQYWTAAERNARVPEFAGALLWNRAIWSAVALAIVALAFATFRFAARGAKASRARIEEAAPQSRPAVGPLPTPRFDAATARAQFLARLRMDLGQVFRSPAFLVLVLIGVFNSVGGLWLSPDIYGTSSRLLTRVAIAILNGAFTLFPIIIAIYYAGELVWREREKRTHEIIDASAVPDWAFLIPRVIAISLVLIVTLTASVVTGIAVQMIKGGASPELGQYLVWYLIPRSIDWILLATLAMFFQVMTPHKFVGWGLMLVYFVGSITLNLMGFEHVLYNYGGVSTEPLSELNGQGDFWVGAAWMRAYWSAFALMLLVLCHALWRRGTETRLWPRLRRLPRRLKGPAGLIMGTAAITFVAIGVFIFVNTNVWNTYITSREQEVYLADYERTLLAYEATPQPTITDVRFNLDLDPHAPRLETDGRYQLENRTGRPLTHMHVRWDQFAEMATLTVQGAQVERAFDRFNYRIYRFRTPVPVGGRFNLDFTSVIQQRGFRNNGNVTSLVDNGSFINNYAFAPLIGMTRQGLLEERTQRRRQSLPAQLRDRDLDDVRGHATNYVRADWVNADITVTTVADQTPVAPGYRVSDLTRDGRRTARFVTEAPVLNFFSVQSARYEVLEATHRGVALSIYHHPGHDWNTARMVTALKSGLDYFEANFSDYQFRQVRVLEFPAYGTFAQAFANTIPYSEDIGFVADLRDPDKIDYVTYVTAHELGHQWWAHQVVSADVQGAETLTETLAQYSALMTMEKMYGRDEIRRFLRFELDTYLGARGGDILGETPLYRVESQQHIYYQKGGMVMYLLRDVMGEDAVNRALRRVIARFAFKGAPFATSRDLIAALRAEARPEHQALITDLFEKITIYDLKVDDVSVAAIAGGKWRVTMTVSARKLYADDKGEETEAPLDQAFDIGVFTAEPGDGSFDSRDVVLFERRRLRNGRPQTITVIVDREPTHVGVDPYNKWIDRNSDDNVRVVG